MKKKHTSNLRKHTNPDIRVSNLQTIELILEREPKKLRELVVLEESINKRLLNLLNKAQGLNIPIRKLSRRDFEKYQEGQSHLIAVCNPVSHWDEKDLLAFIQDKDSICLILLDEVTDPQNLGAILRTVAAFEGSAVVVPKANSAGITPVVRNIACGGAEIVPFVVTSNLVRLMELLKEHQVWIYGACSNAPESLIETQFPKKVALVFGSEGNGLRRLTREACDHEVSIPIQSAIGSLNVSVSAGIVLYEVMRQWSSEPATRLMGK